MTFTDDDLKRLKEDLEIPRSHGLFLTTQRLVLIDALLARLEAAENCKESLLDVLNHGLKYENGQIHEANTELAKERIGTWRKATRK